jgi:Holliday junction resolvase
MSKQWENDKAKEMHRRTGPEIRVYTCGYSGNNAMPQPDVLVTDVTTNHAMELKGPIQSDRVYIEDEDIEQLLDCENANTAIYLVVKFSRREPLVVRYFDNLTTQQHPEADEYNSLSAVEKFRVLIPSCFNPRVTDSGTLALDKPSTSKWPSASAGSDDADAILSGLGITTDKSVETEL